MNAEDQRVDALYEATLAELRSFRPHADLGGFERAYRVASEAHRGQRRRSGEPYLTHPVEVTRILLDLLRRRSDLTILEAALLHDTVEDNQDVTLVDLQKNFGSDVAVLVDGVTKIGDLPFRTAEGTQSENYRKMLLSMAKDIRVILIKLADRLHNMRTLDSLREEKRVRIARETKEIYAPIAHRLGIARFKWELEDLAYKYLDPEGFREIVGEVAQKRAEREKAIDGVIAPIRARLSDDGIVSEVNGRAKHLWSIRQKMERLNAPFSEIYDLLGVRVLTENRDDCYRVLGAIHDLYTPVADRLRDYIAMPKSNMYQSLHTTVTVPMKDSSDEKWLVEIQIRTREMHRVSEIGIAAHYGYKEGGTGPDKEIQEKLGEFIVHGTTEWHDDAGDPGEFLDFLRTSLYQDEVFVFTPRGGLKRLPRGATPIDFAYAIHSDVGSHCVGAKVNGRIVPLRYELKSGEVVEIMTSPQAQPSEDWVKIAATSRAKSKIRRWLNEARLEVSVRLGRDILMRELKRRRLKMPPDRELLDASQSFGLADLPLLQAKIGQGDISVQSVVERLYPETRRQEKESRTGAAMQRLRDLGRRREAGLHIGNIDGLMIRVAKCCQPIPGDKVIGIITRGRGISVHRVDCPNTFDDRIEPERRIEVQWDVERDQRFLAGVVVHGDDRSHLLVELASAIARLDTEMRHVSMSSLGDGEARGEFVLEVKNVAHLTRVLAKIRKVRGVRSVERTGALRDSEEG